MKNKVELKRVILCNVLIIFTVAFLFGIFEFYQYKRYFQNFNNKLGMIISHIVERYPDVDKNELMKILNDEYIINENLLKKYGMNITDDSIILKNKKLFIIFSILNIFILIILSLIIFYVFLRYNNSKDKSLNKITKYIEELNNKNYKLDIDDNSEDELSILKNEIYKTTVMLKETAENSMNDKIYLKDSLSDISHQLKTPLASITIMLDNILDNPDMNSTIRTDFIKDIKREIININFLVNSLLKLSKLDANSIHFTNKEENIEDLIINSIKNVSILCDLKNVEINVISNKSAKILCDIKWQTEAITNILKNAVEHSRNNSFIDITYEENNIYSQIQIKDYGIGIESQDLPHIFDRFYKGKNSANDSIGIGLALAKSIIEKNNGYISVDSQLDVGTIFTIKYMK